MATHKTREKLADHLGKSLRAARDQAKLTQVDVAERIGIASEVYGRMERGRVLPSVPTLRKLCRVLRVDANALLALATREPLEWLEEEGGPPPEDSPRVRRLLRSLRQMNEVQLAALQSMAQSMLKYSGERRNVAAARE
jgi:transcriptional regulator with XRE-family HTH domain